METICFKQQPTTRFAQSNNIGILVSDGWTVAIPKDKCVHYVRNYNKDVDNGFYEHDDKVCLTHGAAKLMLSQEETNAIIELIRVAYIGGLSE